MPTVVVHALFILAFVGLPVAVSLGALLVLGGAVIRRFGHPSAGPRDLEPIQS